MPLPKLLAAALLLGASVLAGAPAPIARAAVPVLVIDGRGFGHGVGLSQWGAEGLAREGYTTEQILATFYPGTALATTAGDVRVPVHESSGSVTLEFPQGGQVQSAGGQAPGFPVAVGPGGRIRVWYDGSHRAEALVTGQAAAATPYQQDCELVVMCEPGDGDPADGSDPGGAADEPATDGGTGTGGSGSGSTPGGTGSGGTGSGGTGSGGTGSGGTGSGTTATGGDSGTPSGDHGGGSGSGGTATGPAAPPPTQPPAAPAPASPAGASAASSSTLWAVPSGGGAITVAERGRTYRGALEAIGGSGRLRIVNQVDVETYVKGMAEVPGTWPAAAVGAQSIAARTYALRAMQASGEICDDQRCQVYVGVAAENPGQSAAVDATRGRVLVHDGKLAAAVYSSDAGGHSATTLEGFGTPDGVYPYLQAVDYPDVSGGPEPWRVEVGLTEVASRFGYPGQLTAVRVASTGPSGRALEVELVGPAGNRTVDGRSFASRLGLKSTLFELGTGDADEAPAAPAPAELQAMPDDAGKLPAMAARGKGAGAGGQGARPDQVSFAAIEALAGTRAAVHDARERASTEGAATPLAPVLIAAASILAVVGFAASTAPVRAEVARSWRSGAAALRATLRRWSTRRARAAVTAAPHP
jgi:SpoIID/LytB domain protein